MGAVLTHTFAWGNNPRRAVLKGRACRILATSRPASRSVRVYARGIWTGRRAVWGSVLVEWADGSRDIVSRRALRRIG